MQRKRQEETRAAKRRQNEKGGRLKVEIGEIRDEWWRTGGYIGKDGELEMGRWECKTGREERWDGGVWRKRDGQRREKRGEGLRRGGAEDRKRGWEEGERCLERGSGVRDWKTEEARKLHSNQAAQLRSVWHWTAHDRRRLFFSVIVTCYLIAKRERAGDVRAI